MLVSDGQPFNFNYVTFDRLAGLSIAANIYDETIPTSPIVVATKQPLQDRGLGLYTGAFQGVAGKNYSVEILVYTDNTFNTINNLRAPGGETFQCVAQQGVSTVLVMVAANLKVNVKQNILIAKVRQNNVKAKVQC